MSPAIGTRISHAKTCLRTADAVCFDVDSTVVTSEGIDDLARFLGCGDKVKELTAKAMGGSMPYHEALELRLNAMRPSETQVATMLREEPLLGTAKEQPMLEAVTVRWLDRQVEHPRPSAEPSLRSRCCCRCRCGSSWSARSPRRWASSSASRTRARGRRRRPPAG